VTFGLGDTVLVDKLTVTWPDGQVQDVPVETVDRVVSVSRAAGH